MSDEESGDTLAELATIIAEEMQSRGWREIVQTAIGQAQEGDAKARAWLTEQLHIAEEEEMEQLSNDAAMGRTFRELGKLEMEAAEEELKASQNDREADA